MSRHHLLLILVATITSAIAIVLGRRHGMARLGAAIVATVELVGATALFFVANLAVGTVLVLGARRLTGAFTTLYDVSDVTLLMLSVIQAAVVERWRRRPTFPETS